MAIDLSVLFGQQPDYSAFVTPAEQQRMQSNANQQGLLNAAIALLAQSGKSPYPVGTGQAIAGALGAGMEGYNQAFDRTLKQMVTGMQLSDYSTKQKQRQAMAEALSLPTPQERIKRLQDLGQYDVVENIAKSERALKQSGLMRQPGEAEAPSPVAPFLVAESPQVKTLASQLDKAFKDGIITEEELLKRLEPLARMEDTFIARSESKAERAEAKAERLTMREQDLMKLSPEQQKQVTGAQNTINAIKEFKDELNKFDPRSFANLSPAARAGIQTKYRNMQLQAKEAYNLGVLNGPDLTIIEQLVADPTSLTGVAIGKKGIEAQASELSRIIADIGTVASQKPKTATEPMPRTQQQPSTKGVRFLGFE
jgi:hypothetical protein